MKKASEVSVRSRPLADQILALLPKQAAAATCLTLYDLCMVLPYASEARIRFALRALISQGYAKPALRPVAAGEDERSLWAWEISSKPYQLYHAGAQILFRDKPFWDHLA